MTAPPDWAARGLQSRVLGGRRALWVTGWLGAMCWAAAFVVFSTLPPHRVWGASAAAGYLGAALAASLLPRPRACGLSVTVALIGAVAVPFGYLLLTGQAQSEVGVIERSAALLLHSGTPYLADPQLVTDYNPYLPGMALFGMPAALLGDDTVVARLFGDARLWCGLALVACLVAGRAVLRRGTAGRAAGAASTTAPAVLVASPLVALPLCVSSVDLPLAGLCWLGIALASCARPGAAGLVLAAACSLKWTALPAVAVAAAVLVALAGGRSAARCAGVWLAGTLALVLPTALVSPGPLVEQVLAFPTGRADIPTPAASPLPGRLLADLGPIGWCAAVLLLLCGGAAVAVSLVTRPPTDCVAAIDRLAVGLCVAFLFAPAGRFGYFALPILLAIWSRVAVGPARYMGARPALTSQFSTRHVPSAGQGYLASTTTVPATGVLPITSTDITSVSSRAPCAAPPSDTPLLVSTRLVFPGSRG